MASRPGRSGGRKAKSLDELLVSRTYRGDRHAQLLTLPVETPPVAAVTSELRAKCDRAQAELAGWRARAAEKPGGPRTRPARAPLVTPRGELDGTPAQSRQCGPGAEASRSVSGISEASMTTAAPGKQVPKGNQFLETARTDAPLVAILDPSVRSATYSRAMVYRPVDH